MAGRVHQKEILDKSLRICVPVIWTLFRREIVMSTLCLPSCGAANIKQYNIITFMSASKMTVSLLRLFRPQTFLVQDVIRDHPALQ